MADSTAEIANVGTLLSIRWLDLRVWRTTPTDPGERAPIRNGNPKVCEDLEAWPRFPCLRDLSQSLLRFDFGDYVPRPNIKEVGAASRLNTASCVWYTRRLTEVHPKQPRNLVKETLEKKDAKVWWLITI